ncbi:MAG: hypothetical protein RIQ81_2539 [Pseudomonadota bacterium]
MNWKEFRKSRGRVLFGFGRNWGGRHFALGVWLLACGGCGATDVVEIRGREGAAFADGSQSRRYIPVEEVVQRFQLAGGDSGPLSDADVEARLASMPKLSDLVPEGRLQLMPPMDPGQFLADPQSEREVIDLRAHDTGIRNQGSEGLCTAFAAVAAVENMAHRAFGLSLDLSERAHWRNYREYVTTSSLRAAKANALIPEAVWPYSSSRPSSDVVSAKTARLRNFEELDLDHREVIKSVREGNPVVIAMGVTRSLMSPAEGGIVRAGREMGGAGHAITIVGAIVDARVGGGGYYIIKNSWGAGYGDNGYAYVAFDYCQSTYCYLWKVDDVGVFKEGIEVSSLSVTPPVPGENPGVKPGEDPVPSPSPAPSPSPSVEPVTPAVTEGDFAVKARTMALYSRRYDEGFYLTLVASERALREVAKVEYWTSDSYANQGYFKVTNKTPGDSVLDPHVFDSMFYPASRDGWTTYPARVTLRDGRVFKIRGAQVDF